MQQAGSKRLAAHAKTTNLSGSGSYWPPPQLRELCQKLDGLLKSSIGKHDGNSQTDEPEYSKAPETRRRSEEPKRTTDCGEDGA